MNTAGIIHIHTLVNIIEDLEDHWDSQDIAGMV